METHLEGIICKRTQPYTLTQMLYQVKVMQSLEDQNMVSAAWNLKWEFCNFEFLMENFTTWESLYSRMII